MRARLLVGNRSATETWASEGANKKTLTMRIDCPFCGARDQSEFSYLGDATVARPGAAEPLEKHVGYAYLRNNPAGAHSELWFHGYGCRSWLRVARDVRTHAIDKVEAIAEPDSGDTP